MCPVRDVWSNRIHGSCLRFPADVPIGGRSVVLQLRVRRFACRNPGCTRRTFVEQIPGLTRRRSQRTERLRSTLAAVGLALAGRVAAPRVVGVDEYATARADTTEPSSSTSTPASPSTCCRTGHPTSRPGSPNGQALRSSAGTGHRSSPKAPAPAHAGRPGRGPVAPVAQPERSRRTGRRSASQLAPRPCPGRPRTRAGARSKRGTARFILVDRTPVRRPHPWPGTLPSTRCWRPGTAAARASVSSA